MPWVRPSGFRRLQPRVGGGGGQHHRRAGPRGELDGGDADAGRAGLHQHDVALLHAAELEQAVVGGAEGHGDRGGQLHVHAGRDHPGGAGGTARSSAWLPKAPVVTALSPTLMLSTSSPTATTSPAAW